MVRQREPRIRMITHMATSSPTPLHCAPLLFAILLACGAPQPVDRPDAPAGPAAADIAYNQTCYSLTAKHQQSVKAGRYRPTTLKVSRWPGSAVAARKELPEAEVADALADGKVRSMLVLGRGGTGKSELARMIEAHVCGKVRVVRLSLPWRVVPMQGSVDAATNVILTAIATELRVSTKNPKAAVDQAMAGRHWVALLDGLDEVALSHRPRILRDIEHTRKQMPDMRLAVLARPPVLNDAYGLKGMDAAVEMLALPCAEVELALAGGGAGDDRAKALRAFVARYELDTKLLSAQRCVYPHMASWRDLAVLRSLARVHSEARLAERTGARLQRDRTGIYLAYLKTLLRDDLVGQDFGPDDALDLVDGMVAAGRIGVDARSVALTLDECLGHVGAADAKVQRGRCQALLQSALFVRPEGKGAWQFANESIADLFLARRLDRKMAARGPSACAAVTAGNALDSCNEIAGFLLGLPRGRQCAPEVLERLCDKADMSRLQLLLEVNLPGGKDRASLLFAARKRVKAGGFKPCVAAELNRLWEALPGPMRAEASQPKP